MVLFKIAFFLCFAVWVVLEISQVSAGGDVHPIQVAESLWGHEAYRYDYSDYLNDGPPPAKCKNAARVNDADDIQWFKDCIVDVYGFIKNDTYDQWDVQGTFTNKFNDDYFIKAALRAEAFFKANSNWAATKGTFSCLQLLYITAARYLLVVRILWQENKGNLIQCGVTSDKRKILTIPTLPNVCYPYPFGSASCTSDYDVGLVGKESGQLVQKFNEYFRTTFSTNPTTSEEVFDVNVYAYDLEYAIPLKFQGLLPKFTESVRKADGTVDFKMQELVNAYYKVFKYNEAFFDKLIQSARSRLGKVKIVVDFLTKWDNNVKGYNTDVPLKNQPRQAHNDVYQNLLVEIYNLGGYQERYTDVQSILGKLGKADLYAAEAYHTRGAIRYVVGGLQMKFDEYKPEKLRNMDLWVSMIENWGESIKEYQHSCQGRTIVEKCVLEMSKYMWRMVAAMKHLKERIDAYKQQLPNAPDIGVPLPQSLVFFDKPSDPEEIIRNWYLKFKKPRLKSQIETKPIELSAFFNRFNCAGVVLGQPLNANCLENINTRVDEYNQWMAVIFLHNLKP